MAYTVIYTGETSSRGIGEFDSLEDAVAAAYQAGAIYDDNAIEALEQGRRSTASLHVRDNDATVRIAAA